MIQKGRFLRPFSAVKIKLFSIAFFQFLLYNNNQYFNVIGRKLYE